MMRLTDDPCIVTGAQGIGRLDHKAFRGMMKDASWTLREFELGDDVQVRLLRDDVAVVAYVVKEELMVGNQPVTLKAADSSTWVRRDGRWVCAVHTEALQGIPLAAIVGRSRIRSMAKPPPLPVRRSLGVRRVGRMSSSRCRGGAP